jgi:hypothetical protein
MFVESILALKRVPSCATISRLSPQVEKIMGFYFLSQRLIKNFHDEMDKCIVGHLSIDSTVIEAREKIKLTKSKNKVLRLFPKKRFS